MKLFEKNAAELSEMLQKKECGAAELTKDVLSQIEMKESSVGAYVTCCQDCLEQAEKIDMPVPQGRNCILWQGFLWELRIIFPPRESALPALPECWKIMCRRLMPLLYRRFGKQA